MQELLTGPENPELLDAIFNGDGFKKAMQLWLPFLDKRGFLEKMIRVKQLWR